MLCFLASLVGSASAWRSAIGLVGGHIDRLDAGARYGIGSLINSFAPARIGDAARLALFSRALDSDERLWQAGGSFVVVGATRALVLALLIVAGSIAGALPLWPVAVLFAVAALVVLGALTTRNRTANTRVAHALDAFRVLGRSRGAAHASSRGSAWRRWRGSEPPPRSRLRWAYRPRLWRRSSSSRHST